ncbi:hypothetical protein K9L16_02610 [Candidatus Pacearchaeota archaeon]|nr:hypothetical protein [Candidatus Pacearchaeota archaeon]
MKRINLSKLSEGKKEKFVEEYSKLLTKWEKELKNSFLQKIEFNLSMKFWDILKKYAPSSKFKKSMEKRKELLKFTNNDVEKEIINSWINMDRETIKWGKQIEEQINRSRKNKILSKNFLNGRTFENASKLYENQILLIKINEISNKSVLYKVKQQERIYELSKQLKRNKSKKTEIISLGFIADILSRSDQFTGVKSAVIYSIAKEYQSDFRNLILFTNGLKRKILKSGDKLNIIKKDLEKLREKIKNDTK